MSLDNATWPDASLAEVATAIKDSRTTSEAVTRACLERIETWQPRINAFIRLEAEEALAAAREADRELERRGPRGPLHGVPLAHKDLFARGGKPVSAGSVLLNKSTIRETATVLERLSQAGAINLGALNLSEFAAYSTGENPHYGDCKNPWNVEYISGGSSSGSAAAVAARLAFGSLGSDTGGSSRSPPALCGVVGLKPTYGLISRYGVIPRAWSLDTIGIIARTAEDCALLLEAIAGHDPKDATTSRLPPPRYSEALADSPERLRIGVAQDHCCGEVDPQISSAITQSVEYFRAAGAEISSISMPFMETASRFADVLMKSEAAAIHGRWMKSQPRAYSAAVFSRNEAGFHIPATRYVEVLTMRNRIAAAFVTEVLAKIDVLLLPAIPIRTPRFSEVRAVGPESINSLVSRLTPYLRPFNYLGLPAMALPCGFDTDRMPIALQLVGRPFSEARLLAVAHAFQTFTSFHSQPPFDKAADANAAI